MYDAPVDLDFPAVMNDATIPLRTHLGLYDDETAELCHWHIPAAHSLETWSDLRTFDGSVTIQQPLIAPLTRESRLMNWSSISLASRFGSGQEIVHDYWKAQFPRAISMPAGGRHCKRDF